MTQRPRREGSGLVNRVAMPAGVAPKHMDITQRLRRWVHAVDAVPASDLMDEAADEIERLRRAIRRLADQDATLSVCDGNLTVTMDATLTDEEQWAIREAAGAYMDNDDDDDEKCAKIAATLHGLLKRPG